MEPAIDLMNSEMKSRAGILLFMMGVLVLTGCSSAGSVDIAGWMPAKLLVLELADPDPELGATWTLPPDARIVAGTGAKGKIGYVLCNEAGFRHVRSGVIGILEERSVRVRSWDHVTQSGGICGIKSREKLTPDAITRLDAALSELQIEVSLMLASEDNLEITMVGDRISNDILPRLEKALGEFELRRMNDWRLSRVASGSIF